MQRWLVLTMMLVLISACRQGDESVPNQQVKVLSENFSNCLGSRAASGGYSQEMYVVRAIGGKNYLIEHQNATFNCCLPEGIAFTVEFKNDTLFFADYEKVKGNCKCICTYNTSAEIGEIDEGNYELCLTTGGRLLGSVQLNFKPDMYLEIPVSDLIESL